MSKRVDLKQLNSLVADKNKLLVMFSAEWCGQCKMNDIVIQEIKDNYPDIDFIEVDVDDNMLWDNDVLNIKSVPTFIGFSNRQTLFTEQGYQSKEDLIKLIKQIE